MAAAIARRRAEPLPRSLLWVGAPAAAVLLVVFFVYLGFPYDRLATWIAWQVGDATGAHVSIGSLEPHIGLLPGFEARDVRVLTAGGERIELARAWLRPALRPSWLRGQPALAGELEGELGSADGVVWLGAPGGFEGELRGVDVARLPFEAALAGVSLRGRLDADVDLAFGDAGPEGTTSFVATQGMLSHPALPIAVPFDSLSGEFEWGGELLVRVVSLRLEGPLVSGSGAGTLGRAEDPTQAPLDLAVELQARDPNVQSFLGSAGARADRDGTVRASVSGTLSDPVLR